MEVDARRQAAEEREAAALAQVAALRRAAGERSVVEVEAERQPVTGEVATTARREVVAPREAAVREAEQPVAQEREWPEAGGQMGVERGAPLRLTHVAAPAAPGGDLSDGDGEAPVALGETDLAMVGCPLGEDTAAAGYMSEPGEAWDDATRVAGADVPTAVRQGWRKRARSSVPVAARQEQRKSSRLRASVPRQISDLSGFGLAGDVMVLRQFCHAPLVDKMRQQEKHVEMASILNSITTKGLEDSRRADPSRQNGYFTDEVSRQFADQVHIT